MSNAKTVKETAVKRKEDLPFELESQFILRLPSEPSQELRKAIRTGATNLKDRLTIQVENDVRHGTLKFDNWVFAVKIVDLPSIIESCKTLDRKTLYKTADISQMMICLEEDEGQTTEDDDATKKKPDKKELIKKEKKYQWPHGITPPLKNVRKRRFRKTLKKKYVDAPEIENEVKRLFRVDNEAVSVKWEVITEDDTEGGKHKHLMGESQNSNIASPTSHEGGKQFFAAEHDIFGEMVSSSEDEGDVNIVDSADDDASSNLGAVDPKARQEFLTHFSPRMIQRQTESPQVEHQGGDSLMTSMPDHIQAALEDAGIVKKETKSETTTSADLDSLLAKRDELRRQIVDVTMRRQAREMEIASIDNQALQNRLQPMLDALSQEERLKQQEYDEVSALIQHRSQH